MTRTLWIAVVVALLLALAGAPAARADVSGAERAKIEAVLGHVAGMIEARFLRNGKSYSASEAVRLMRHKWGIHEDEITDARTFIDRAATKSETTGKPYRIRLADGQIVESGPYLLDVLKKIEEAQG